MTYRPVTATVVGLGPAGRIAAHRGAARGWKVTAFDPSGGTLPSTIGVWCDQLPGWVPHDFLSTTFEPSIILSDGSHRLLRRAYGVINKESLRALDGFRVERRSLSTDEYSCDGTAHTIVATGAEHAAAGRSGQVRQLAIGHVFSLADVPRAVQLPVLMDFTPALPGDDPTEPASFSYRIPLDETTFLVEETILAVAVPITRLRPNCANQSGDSGGASGDYVDDSEFLALLRQRQNARLGKLGLSESQALAAEVVSFPLLATVSDKNRRNRRGVSRFGFAGGWMHSATGYSVGFVLAGVDRFLAELELEAEAPTSSARAAWSRRNGRVSDRLQRGLRERGLAALLGFDAAETYQFFSAFFSLPEDRIFDYLIGSSPLRTVRAMVELALPLSRRSPLTCARLVLGFIRGPGRWRSSN